SGPTTLRSHRSATARSNGAIRLWLPIREDGFGRKRHFPCHHQVNQSIHRVLGELLPTSIVIAELLRPIRQLARTSMRLRQDGGRQPIGIHQWNLQPVGETLCPERRFARSIVSGENERDRFLCAGHCLIQPMDQRRWSLPRRQSALKRPPTKRPKVRLPVDDSRTILLGSLG